MSDEQLMAAMAFLAFLVAERDNKRFLRYFAAIICILAIWRYSF